MRVSLGAIGTDPVTMAGAILQSAGNSINPPAAQLCQSGGTPQFDSTGLTVNQCNQAYNSLTATQYACAMNPSCDPSTAPGGLLDQINADLTCVWGWDPQTLQCLAAPVGNTPAIPNWVWYLGLGALAFLVVKR